LTPWGLELRTLGYPARSQSLYRLRYPCSWFLLHSLLNIYLLFICVLFTYFVTWEPGQRSRYSDWLRAGWPRGRCFIPGRGKIFFSSVRCQGRFWGSPSLLSNGYQQLFPRG
jgi:hypothetical protein